MASNAIPVGPAQTRPLVGLSFLFSLQGALQLLHGVDQKLRGAPGFICGIILEFLCQFLVLGGQPLEPITPAD